MRTRCVERNVWQGRDDRHRIIRIAAVGSSEDTVKVVCVDVAVNVAPLRAFSVFVVLAVLVQVLRAGSVAFLALG